ncbi:ATP-binding protein [Papillibacter cinnamivorans]|uniref:Anti-sigma regulatory factor (Ser/Thr protein kinase) n=1 Tax=Papillibacter cinnamivorans DSM 12816 TaxID=1122930 RepID=A0A1W2A4K3_9FIRM|nr:ATP-binding protein [Papillibacter cinnamivorans]SMC55607.1 Anti-sigma regulatory factor (Ser/Thr protein kinase) [Papillibacter cinnamivorans DSM 12816]
MQGRGFGSGNTVTLHYDVDAGDFSSAGEASANLKRTLKQLGFPPEVVRRATIAMYEGEINMFIHAGGGVADVEITPDEIRIKLVDSGPGIPDIALAMQKGYSTASELAREMGFGAGMGLPNMQSYTDELIVESQVGKGTSISMLVRVGGSSAQ